MPFRAFYQQVLGATDPQLLQRFSDASHEEVFHKGQRLVRMGEPRSQIYFLKEGILRGFVVDEAGQEVTDCFMFQYGDVLVGAGDLTQPERLSIQALTDCRVVALPLYLLLQAMDHPQIMQCYNLQLNAALARHCELKMMLYRCSAMERYQWFRSQYPGLEDVVSGKHLSSFLGITPVTLSRLRRQLRETAPAQET